MKPCRWPGCAELVARGYCGEHQQKVDAGYRKKGKRAAYRTRRWRALRRRVLAEQPLCADGCGQLAVEVDHVKPVEDGGAMWERANLQGLAHACHSRKTREDVARRGHR